MTLASTSDNPAPPGAVEEDVQTADGVRLRAVRWTPAGRGARHGRDPRGAGRVHRKIFRDGEGPARSRFCGRDVRLAGPGRFGSAAARRAQRPRRRLLPVRARSRGFCRDDPRAALPEAVVRPRPLDGRGDPAPHRRGRPLPVRSAGPHFADDRGEGGRPSRPGPVRDRRPRRPRLRRRLHAGQRRGRPSGRVRSRATCSPPTPRGSPGSPASWTSAPHLFLGGPTIGWAHAAFRAMRRIRRPELSPARQRRRS